MFQPPGGVYKYHDKAVLKRFEAKDHDAFHEKNDHLSNDENFNGKLEPIRYGVRVVYANEFHVDIMLGILVDSERLQVSDWKDNIWVNRNPKGYIGWFESKYIADYTDISKGFAKLYEIGNEIPKPHQGCLCGSKVKFKKCHYRICRDLLLIPKKIFCFISL